MDPVTKLRLLRPRTLISLLGLALVCWLLVREVTDPRNAGSLSSLALAQPLWLAAAFVLAVAGFVAATMSFVGFVPERLDLRRSLLTQLAGSFANVVAPSGVGGMALGTRFLLKSGIPAGQAMASVGVSQVVGAVLHVLLLVLFGLAAQVHLPLRADFAPAAVVVPVVLLALAVPAAVVLGVPSLRRWTARQVRGAFSSNLPRMRELTRRQPGKLAVGVIGQLLVSLVAATCLYTCGLALGQHPAFAPVTVATLIGGTVALVVPTPGGVGGVEAVLAYALREVTGVPYDVALVQVVLYRGLTLWLPTLPGWLALVWLQRRGAL